MSDRNEKWVGTQHDEVGTQRLSFGINCHHQWRQPESIGLVDVAVYGRVQLQSTGFLYKLDVVAKHSALQLDFGWVEGQRDPMCPHFKDVRDAFQLLLPKQHIVPDFLQHLTYVFLIEQPGGLTERQFEVLTEVLLIDHKHLSFDVEHTIAFCGLLLN